MRFKNLKELKFHSFFDARMPDMGFMSFLSESVEVLKLSYFAWHIIPFTKNIKQFKNLRVLELEFPMQLVSGILPPNQLVATVWSQIGIEQLIFHNKNLTKIVLTLHVSEFGADTLDVINNGLTEYVADDGSRWKVQKEFFGYSFCKVLE